MDGRERTAALRRLQDDYLRGALDAEEYARLRERSCRPGAGSPRPLLVVRAPCIDATSASTAAGYGPGVVTGTHYASWGRRAAAIVLDGSS